LSRPLTFPRLTRSEAQALASLATQGPGHLLDALPAGQSGRLRLAPLPPGQDLQQAQGSQRLHLEWAGGQMALDLAPWVIDRWLLMTLDVAESATLPAPFRQAALDHVIAWVAQALGGSGRGPAQLLRTESAPAARPAEAPHALAVDLELAEGLTLPAVLHVDSMALMLVGSLVQDAPASDDAPAMDELPVPLQLCIGQSLVPVQQLAQLRQGGLVIMSESFMQDGPGLQLRAASGHRQHWCLSARIDGPQLQLLSAATIMNTPHNAPSDNDDAIGSLDDMPVLLSFDLGHKTVSLAQLRQLGEGQALPLDRPVQSGVTIRANGAVIGQGQLVDIDGQLGVLVSQLHTAAAKNG
jgi:type III secretion protein Q